MLRYTLFAKVFYAKGKTENSALYIYIKLYFIVYISLPILNAYFNAYLILINDERRPVFTLSERYIFKICMLNSYHMIYPKRNFIRKNIYSCVLFYHHWLVVFSISPIIVIFKTQLNFFKLFLYSCRFVRR